MARKKANYPLVEGLEITTLAAEGKAYHIPRHSDAMDPAAYRQGLALWLSKCPMTPETPAAMER